VTATELANLVADMRRAQRDYFRTHTPDALVASKRLERAVDEAAREVLTQPTLNFGDAP
jgi:hypothetical protein